MSGSWRNLPFAELDEGSVIDPKVGVMSSQVSPETLATFVQPNLITQKQQEAIATADRIKKELSSINYTDSVTTANTGAGLQSTDNQMQRDLILMHPFDFSKKYKDIGGNQVLAEFDKARILDNRSIGGKRTISQTLGDAGLDVASGAIGAVGGPLAFGAGLVSDKAGAFGSQLVTDISQGLQGLQSDALTKRKATSESRAALEDRDRAVQRKLDEVTKGPVSAALSDVGRQVSSTAQSLWRDPALAGSVGAQGFGSLGAAVLLAAATGGSSLGLSATARATIAIAGIEGGSQKVQVTSEVLKMSFKDLETGSPRFKELIDQGMSKEDARISVANSVGNLAGGLTIPPALLAGRLAAGLVANPLGAVGARGIAGNVVRETLEEPVQAIGGGVSANFALQNVDPAKKLTDEVGRQIVEGAVGGALSAGAIQAPRIAAETVKAAAGVVGAGVGVVASTVAGRAAATEAANEASAPNSPQNLRKAVDASVANAEVTNKAIAAAIIDPTQTPPKDAQAVTAYSDSIKTAFVLDPTWVPQQLADDTISPEFKTAITGTTDVLDLVTRLSALINPAKDSKGNVTKSGLTPEEITDVAGLFNETMSNLNNIADANSEVVDSLPTGHPVREQADAFRKILTGIQTSATFVSGSATSEATVIKALDDNKLSIPTEADLESGKGTRNLNMAADAVVLASKKDTDLTGVQVAHRISIVDLALKHSAPTDGDIPPLLPRTPEQRAALLGVKAILYALQTNQTREDGLGIKNKIDRVTYDLLEGGRNEELASGTGQARAVAAAMRANNPTDAKTEMSTLADLIEHMQNKITAINQHFDAGAVPSIKFQALSLFKDGNRKFFESTKGVGVTPSSENSVAFAQRTSLEEQKLVDVYNGLVEGFSELGFTKLKSTPMNALLMDGPADVVAKRFTKGDLVKGYGPAKPPVDADAPITSRITAEQATGLSDKGIQDRINRINARTDEEVGNTNRIIEDAATLDVLTNEQSQRKNKGFFRNLLGDVTNNFSKAYAFSKEATSNLTRSDTPLRDVINALGSTNLMARMSGANFRAINEETTEAYLKELKIIPKIINNINDYIQFKPVLSERTIERRTDDKKSLESLSLQEQYDRETDPAKKQALLTWPDSKLLNLMEVVNGKIVLNQQLAEIAGLAAVQWMLTGTQMGARKLDADDFAKLLGVPVEATTGMGTMFNHFNASTSKEDVVKQLTTLITRFWGLTPNPNTDGGFVNGIPEAFAKEILRHLVDEGKIIKSSTDIIIIDNNQVDVFNIFTEASNNSLASRSNPDLLIGDRFKQLKADNVAANIEQSVKIDQYDRYSIPELTEDNPLNKDLSAIERVVMISPELTIHFAPPKTPNTVHNSQEPLSKKAEKVITTANANPLQVDVGMYDLLYSFGATRLANMFTLPEPTGNENKNDLESIKGERNSIISAYKAMVHLFNEVDAEAENLNIDPGEVKNYRAHTLISSSRLMMLGAVNEQSSKLLRIMNFPNWATLDIANNTAHAEGFYRGIAQALGVKLNNMTYPQILKETEIRTEKLQASMDVIRQWKKDESKGIPDGAENIFINNFNETGYGLNPASFHALVELVNLENAQDATAFRTSVYLEADGVANGSSNAVNMLGSGEFTKEGLIAMSYGRRWFGANGKAMTDKTEFNDLYKASANAFSELQAEVWQSLPKDSAEADQFKALMNVLATLYPKNEVLFDANSGELLVGRSTLKNPIMISLYGSGSAGIAGNLVEVATKAIYARISFVTEAMANDSKKNFAYHFFNENPKADKLLVEFNDNMTLLTTKKASIKNERINISNTGLAKFDISKLSFEKLQNYKFSRLQLENMRENMKVLFVDQMIAGVNKTVGTDVVENAKLIGRTINVMSIYYKGAYLRLYNEKLEKKRVGVVGKNLQNLVTLSRNEEKEVLKSIVALIPSYDTGWQNLVITGSSETMGLANQSLDLTGRTPTQAPARNPGEAGVAGQPLTVIGSGDAAMIMNAITNYVMAGTLPIYDGVHLGADKFQEQGAQLNNAVYDTWQANPLAIVSKRFDEFLGSISNEPITDDMRKSLTRAFGEFKALSDRQISDYQKGTAFTLKNLARSAEARIATMAIFSQYVDQMAATNSLHVHVGREPVSTNLDDLVIEFNVEYYKQLNILETRDKVKLTDNPYPESTEAEVSILTADATYAMLIKRGLQNQAVVSDIISNKALGGYTVVSGSVSALMQYARNNELQTPGFDPDTFAITTFTDKTIYLRDTTDKAVSNETLIHEVVHAATFEKVLASIIATQRRTKLNPEQQKTASAVAYMTTLMEQFKAFDTSLMSVEAQTAYRNALLTINSFNNQSNLTEAQRSAMALNEFMSWGLANQDLNNLLSTKLVDAPVEKTKAVNVFVKFFNNLKEAIKTLVFGKRSINKIQESMLTALRFNTTVVVQSDSSLLQTLRGITLSHSESPNASERITEIGNNFNRILAFYVDRDSPSQTPERETFRGRASSLATVATENAIANGFSDMTEQAAFTFKTIVTALATEAAIDPTSMAMAQVLYNHAKSKLEYTDFMVDPTSTNPNDIALAQAKYDTVLGITSNTLNNRDQQNRSTILPVFLGLAMVDGGFRAILSKISLPKTVVEGNNKLDVALEQLGWNAINALGSRYAGTKNTTNVQAALDALVNNINNMAIEQKGILEQGSDIASGVLDKTNAVVIEKASFFAAKTVSAAERLAGPNPNLAGKALVGLAKTVGGVINQDIATMSAENALKFLDTLKGFESFKTITRDMIGRVTSNALVYDMIKRVKSHADQVRQQFRLELPVALIKHFKVKPKEAQWSDMHTAFGNTGIVSLEGPFTQDQALAFYSNNKALNTAINTLETTIKGQTGNWTQIQTKAKQLANYMLTKSPGSRLLRNADAITTVLNATALTKEVDQLVSLYAIQALSQDTKDSITSLVQADPDAIKAVMSYMYGRHIVEMEKIRNSPGAALNYYKGYMPSLLDDKSSLVIANDSDHAAMLLKSYVRIGEYKGSKADRFGGNRGYYLAPSASRASVNSGIMQTVTRTGYGVDLTNGSTLGLTAGRVDSLKGIAIITRAIQQGDESGMSTEFMMPIFDDAGVVVAYERSADPSYNARQKTDNNLARMIGVWRGRQEEESMATEVNTALVDALVTTYKEDIAKDADNKSRYVNLLDSKDPLVLSDPVTRDMIRLMPKDIRDYAKAAFGGAFYVRKDMLFDTLGYRNASLGDAWTGNSRWSQKTQDTIRDLSISMWGNDAYRKLVNAEALIKSTVTDLKTLIVVKSVIIPVANGISNMYHLIARGVPILDVVRGQGRKLTEIHSYTQNQLKLVDLEVQLSIEENALNKNKANGIRAEMQAIRDSYRRLSIWPLLEAGEFSSINDVGVSRDELLLTSGKVSEYIERQINKLPEPLSTVGRYGILSKDTALFRGLEKSVQYGDFISKAILYEHLTKKMGKTQAEALASVTEEFVNYDRLPGRTRGALEDFGLLWFYNFKLRSVKIALSIIRNNPIHALTMGLLPAPYFFDGGTALTDNLLTKILRGNILFSVGPEMGVRAIGLNPWANIVN